METVRKEADRFEFLKRLEAMTGNRIKREHILLIIAAVVIILVLATPVSSLVTSALGLIIPFKETFTVLKQKRRNEDEVLHLIVFWMLFSIITALDAYSPFLVSLIPLYNAFKFAFLCYIGPLKFRGCELIYESFLCRIPESWYSFESPDNVLEAAAMKVKEAVKSKEFQSRVINAAGQEKEHFKDK